MFICFNPYFAGSYSGRIFGINNKIREIVFQSLFCWKLFWKQEFNNVPCRTLVVSILILLEVILEEKDLPIIGLSFSSFNPYFAGSYSGSFSLRSVNRSGLSFNPYFAGSYSGRPLLMQGLG